MKKLNLVSVFLLFLLSLSACEKILFIHIWASYSHRIQTWPIADALQAKGHEVTYLQSIKANGTHPNITEITPKALVAEMDSIISGEFDVSLRTQKTMALMHTFIFELALGLCKTLVGSDDFKNFIKKNSKFDLVIIDHPFPECAFGIAEHLGAKTIMLDTVVPLPYEADAFGFIPQSSAIPEMELYAPSMPMGFFERLWNTYVTLIWRWKSYSYSFRVDEVLKNGLNNQQLPNTRDLLREVGLVFHAGDVISDYARSLPPMFINVAGTHCRESTQSLPKEMETFLNSTKMGMKDDGFIYISLGSLVVTANLPEGIKQVFFDTIRAFPTVKFLWRWSGEMPKDIPDNLYVSKWFPQVDVLGHKKIKAFVTQNGRPSTLEAVYLGVPMISFPVLGDQDVNANRLSEIGASIKLEISSVTFEEFKDAVEKVVFDTSVKERMNTLKDIFRNRPMSSLDTALWWIDYVLRYKDTKHLRTAGYDQYWFVRRQVDVWAFISISVFVGIISIFVIIRKLTQCIFGVSKLKED